MDAPRNETDELPVVADGSTTLSGFMILAIVGRPLVGGALSSLVFPRAQVLSVTDPVEPRRAAHGKH